MMGLLRRHLRVYGAIAALQPKLSLTYRAWFWTSIVLNTIAMAIYVYFWRAVYANTASLGGLDMQQTINYILLAQIFIPIGELGLVWEFGYNLREGKIAIELLRPVNLVASYYTQYLAGMFSFLAWNIPMALVATFLFGLRWPTSPTLWVLFLVTVLLGRTVLYFFDWVLACITFYTTEIWGLGVLLNGFGLFASGALLPLVMMPGWLQAILQSLPFAQVIYVPIGLLTGILPADQAPRIWLVQLAWIAGLWISSQALFKIAIRKVTVQGG
jgi:ABC-2 type transport system permease protein